MNNINNITFHTKLRELIPSLPSSITPEVLNKICEDESVQPFLKWFYSNVSHDNVLSDECIKLKKHIQENDIWLEDRELDLALAEATKDCPELLKLVESDYWNSNQSLTDLTTEKELYDPDLEHLQIVEESLQKLKECEEKIDNNLDNEIDAVEKEGINVKLIYDKCTSVLEDFDLCHRQFFKAVELLAGTYSNAVEKKGEACMWTHMPIELYIKQLETYNDYLISYAKRQFSMSSGDGNETNVNNHPSILNDSNENEKIKEIMCCQKNLFTSKMHEIITKVEDDASKSLLNYVTEIYNNGNLKAPSTPIIARAEIAELTKSRDFLEENVNLLRERQLVDIVQQFSNVKVIKVLEEEAEARLERRKSRLLRLERLCMLAKEHGHAFTTLLCMLFELQIHRINEIIQFVMDARHYLSMVYSLSSLRNESMQKLQKEYSSILASSKDQNAFCKTFVEMVTLDDSDFQASINYYDELRHDNSEKLKILFEEKLLETIDSSKELESKVMDLFNEEITKGPTNSFKAVPCNVQNEIDKTVKQIEKLETNVEQMRNKLKNMIKETSTPNYEREKLLIWQKFLAHPEWLKTRCQELEELRDQEAFQLN